MPESSAPDCYSLREIAAAAGVADTVVATLAARGCLPVVEAGAPAGGEAWLAHDDAVVTVRALVQGQTPGASTRRALALPPVARTRSAASLLVSTGLHGLAGLVVAGIASLGWTWGHAAPLEAAIAPEPARLVYLVQPGPGGGGGGGGNRSRTPAPKAERAGTHSLSSPLPDRRPPPEPPRVQPPKPLDATVLPPVMAPIASAASDETSVAGVLNDVRPLPDASQGPGTSGGVGTGRGSGLGEGAGSGVGDGSGGGTGGGPYRPGSGVEPPRLLREVKATYTDEARRNGVSGTVDMEITVRRDGTVSDVRVLKGRRGGLDAQAVAAVRQWRFAPARMKTTPVDVIVEVSMEFTLR